MVEDMYRPVLLLPRNLAADVERATQIQFSCSRRRLNW